MCGDVVAGGKGRALLDLSPCTGEEREAARVRLCRRPVSLTACCSQVGRTRVFHPVRCPERHGSRLSVGRHVHVDPVGRACDDHLHGRVVGRDPDVSRSRSSPLLVRQYPEGSGSFSSGCGGTPCGDYLILARASWSPASPSGTACCCSPFATLPLHRLLPASWLALPRGGPHVVGAPPTDGPSFCLLTQGSTTCMWC